MLETVFEFFLWFLYGTGAFLCWLAKGCRTSLEDELSDKHHVRNGSIPFLLLAVLAGLIIYFTNRQ